MRIAIFVSENYDFMFDMIKSLIPRLQKEHELIGVLSFPYKLAKYKGIDIYLYYLRTFGLLSVLRLFFCSLAKRLSIVVRFLFRKCNFYSFGTMYRYYEVQRSRFLDPNSPAVISWLKDKKIDVLLIFIGHILKKEIIKIPNLLILNKHSSLLPEYRGIFPVFWAMMNNEKIGVSIHEVTEEVDAGKIILQKAYGRVKLKTVYGYYELIYSDVADMIEKGLELIKNDKAEAGMSGIGGGSYFGLPAKEDYQKFRKLEYRIV